MIKNQHHCLIKNKKITEGMIREILEKVGKHCLVILEGYDEIPENFNAHLTDIIKNEIYRDCSILVTSRPNAVEELETYVATIASIEGFSKENTKKYTEKVIKDTTKQQAAYEYTQHSVIEEMWRYPILVLFLCLLVNWGEIDLNEETLPVGEFYTRLLNCLYKRYLTKLLDKETKAEAEMRREDVLLRIGKIAFQGMLSNKVAYRMSEILSEIGTEAFAYGILIGNGEYQGNRFLDENADMFVYFAHKSIQEYLAAKYFIHQMSTENQNITDLLGKKHNLDFIERNLMFLTFCGYFIKKIDESQINSAEGQNCRNDEKLPIGQPTESSPKFPLSTWIQARRRRSSSEMLKKLSVRDQLVDYISKCLDKSKVKLEGITIHEEGQWLFLEALPKCAKISNLYLKNLKIRVPIPNLLKGLSRSLKYLHIENCDTYNMKGTIDHSFLFHSLQEIKFSGVLGSLDVLVSPIWRMVRKLDVEDKSLTQQDIAALVQARVQGHLPKLEFPRSVNPESVKHIPVVPVLFGLWNSVENLSLKRCAFSNNDVLTIAEANKNRMLSSVTVINLDDESQYAYKGNFNISGKLSVLMGAAWLKLVVLNLSRCMLGANDIRALGRANSNKYLPSLANLNLCYNRNVSGQLSALLSSPWPLLFLRLRECSLMFKDMDALGGAIRKGHLSRLMKLDLGTNDIPGQVATLLSSPLALRVLNLEACKLTPVDMLALGEANSKCLPELQILYLDCNDISNAGLSNLISHRWSQLLMLSVNGCSLITPDGKNLFEARMQGRFPKLRMLKLGVGNSIRESVISQLTDVIEGFIDIRLDKKKELKRIGALEFELVGLALTPSISVHSVSEAELCRAPIHSAYEGYVPPWAKK